MTLAIPITGPEATHRNEGAKPKGIRPLQRSTWLIQLPLWTSWSTRPQPPPSNSTVTRPTPCITLIKIHTMMSAFNPVVLSHVENELVLHHGMQ